MNIEERINELERHIKRQRIGLFVLATALCGVVSIAASNGDVGVFDTVKARRVHITNDDGLVVTVLGANDGGDGFMATLSAKNQLLLELSSTNGNNGLINTYNGMSGNRIVEISATVDGGGGNGWWRWRACE